LADGARLVLRALGPCDARLLSCHFTALSAESRWGRFLGAKSELSAADLRHFTQIDGERHFAIVALCADTLDMVPGVARFITLGGLPPKRRARRTADPNPRFCQRRKLRPAEDRNLRPRLQ
jgi:hypothetical protein